MKYFSLLFIVLIFIFGGFLYFFKLGSIPNGLYIDEALPGYNAYSILKTGKDEFGKVMPFSFRYYGSYNPPLHIYLTAIPVFLFGLNIFSVRFISAVSGLLSVVVLFLMMRNSEHLKNKTSLIIFTVTTAISPWILFQSRTGYEVVLAYLLFELGVFFCWLSLKNIKLIFIAFLFLSLSVYTAYAERFLVPLFIGGFIFMFKEDLFTKTKSKFLISAIVLLIVSQIPNIFLFFTNSFFPKSNLLPLSSLEGQAGKILLLPKVISLPLAYIREFLSQYMTYFSPRSLFFLPDPDLQRSIPELSVFYNWMIVPYLLGLLYLYKERSNKFIKLIILLLVITPIPAALTKDPFATHRAMPLFLPIIVVIGLGINRMVKLLGKFAPLTFVFLIGFSLLMLWRSYFVLMPHERAKYWGYGYSQLADYIRNNPQKKFVIDQTRSKPHYIELTFFLKYPPEELQKSVDQTIKNVYYQNPPFNADYKFANIETRGINWEKDIYQKEVLVGDELSISDTQAKEHYLTKVLEIRSPLNEIIFIGYETNPTKKCDFSKSTNVSCKK